MNAIALLKADHRTVEELFDKLGQLAGKSRGKKALVEKLVRELSIHEVIEEEVFYPEVRKSVPDAGRQVLKALEEQNVLKWELVAIESMNIEDERFDAKIAVLRDTVLHHVDEEENGLFPMVREAFDVAKLNELGAALERAKKVAPTRPHPRAPTEPPANIIANMAASVIDRARDAGRALRRSSRAEPRKRTAASKGRPATAKRGRASRASAR